MHLQVFNIHKHEITNGSLIMYNGGFINSMGGLCFARALEYPTNNGNFKAVDRFGRLYWVNVLQVEKIA